MLAKQILLKSKNIYKISMNKPGKKIVVTPNKSITFIEQQRGGLNEKNHIPINYSSSTKCF